MLLRLQGKRVDVDADRRDVGVVLVGLHPVEVLALTDREPIVAVELEQGRDDGVLARHTLHTGDGVARLQAGAIPPVGVVEGLLALVGTDDGVIARDERVTLDNPDELLARVVEVELQLVGRGGDGLTARELEHVDQVLVGDLGELAALIRVEVDVVDVEGGSDQALGRNTVADGVGVRRRGLVPAEVVQGVELEVDAHLVVLEGDQGERQARVAAEPELQGHVQGVHGRAGANRLGQVGLTAIAGVVARSAALDDEVRQLRDVAHHLGVAGLLAGLLGELVPDVEPVTIVLVDALATDLELNVGDQVLTDPVEPAELRTRAVGGQDVDLGQRGLQVDAVDQITVALDRARHLLAEVRGTVERVLDRLHGEVRVPAVDQLEERDLRVTRQVNVLCTVGNELHKTTTRHLLYPSFTKKIGRKRSKRNPPLHHQHLNTRPFCRQKTGRMADPPFFKMKAPKAAHPETRTTLDALHSQRIQTLLQEKKDIEKYKKQIAELRETITNTTNPVDIWTHERHIETLEKKIAELESDDGLMDYYLRTGNILFDYYDMQERIQHGSVVATTQATKAKPGSILAILSDLKRDATETEETAAGGAGAGSSTPLEWGARPTTSAERSSASFNIAVSDKRAPQRYDLLNQYLLKEDPEHAKANEAAEDEWTHCEMCGTEMIICMNDASMTCRSCGNQSFILIDSDKPSYKDPPRELSYYAYKKINHFNEWLAQFQAKESTEIPAEIYDQILVQLKKERITNFATLKRTKLREILRNMGETKYYEHIPHIINRLSGQNAPFMSREDEERLRHMFREIQPAFKKHIPKGRRNFLSYGYILYKFCELLEMDEHLACFPLLKNRDKLYIQDQAWKGICQDMKWQYIRTV